MRAIRLFFVCAAFLCSNGFAEAQPGSLRTGVGRHPPPIHTGPPFTFDILTFKVQNAPSPDPFKGGPDSVRVDLYFAVPYQTLEFLFAGDKYVADYSANVEITEHASEKTVFERYRSYTILETPNQHEDRAKIGMERADAEQFSVILFPAREYDVHLSVRDLSSKHEFDTTVRFTPRDFPPGHSAMSDVMLYRSRRGNQRVIPLIGADIGAIESSPGPAPFKGEPDSKGSRGAGVFGELYNMPANSELGVVTEVYAAHNDRRLSEEDIAVREVSIIHTPTNRDSSHMGAPLVERMPLFQDVAFDEIWLGRYVLHTYVLPSVSDTSLNAPEELSKRAVVQAERTLTVSAERGIPISAPDIEQALDQLRTIATGSEWDSLTSGNTAKEKRAAILEFWAKRNPDPRDRYNRPMQVFYSRVQYANDHFSSGMQQGWRSDRGRVYIALGPPEYVDSHPYEAMQKPYEMWEYTSLHARYTFVDQYMLDDYRLVGMPPAPGTFIWDR